MTLQWQTLPDRGCVETPEASRVSIAYLKPDPFLGSSMRALVT